MSTTTVLTVPFGETVNAFNALTPYMGKDTSTPIICALQISPEGTLVATDRYTVGRYKLENPVWAGDDFAGATLPVEAVKWVAAMRPLKLAMGKNQAHEYVFRFTFDSSVDSVQIELGFGADFITAEQSARFMLVKGNFPPVARLFPDDSTEFALSGPISLKTEFLVRVDKAVKWVGDSNGGVARFRFTKTDNPNKPGPAYVRVGERFDALIQPNLLVR